MIIIFIIIVIRLGLCMVLTGLQVRGADAVRVDQHEYIIITYIINNNQQKTNIKPSNTNDKQ